MFLSCIMKYSWEILMSAFDFEKISAWQISHDYLIHKIQLFMKMRKMCYSSRLWYILLHQKERRREENSSLAHEQCMNRSCQLLFSIMLQSLSFNLNKNWDKSDDESWRIDNINKVKTVSFTIFLTYFQQSMHFFNFNLLSK